MLADYDLRKTSHKRFHLVVRRAVTTKKCAKQCAHVFFWRCRCRRRRRRRWSNRLYCFNLSIVAISLQSISRWRVYDRGRQSLLIDVGNGNGNGDVKNKTTIKARSTRIWIILKPDNFFSVLAFRPRFISFVFWKPPLPPPSTTTPKKNNKVNNKKR